MSSREKQAKRSGGGKIESTLTAFALSPPPDPASGGNTPDTTSTNLCSPPTPRRGKARLARYTHG